MDNLTFVPTFGAFIHDIRCMVRLKSGFSGERAIVVPPSVVRQMEADALLAALHITDIGYYPQACHHFRERQAPIDQYVLIYCVNGRGWFSVEGRRQAVSANQYFILPAGLPHAYAADDRNPWTIYWIHFKGTLAPCYAQAEAHPVDVEPSARSRIHDRTSLFEEMFNTLKAGYAMENLRYAAALAHHYLGSLKYIRQYRDAQGLDGRELVSERAIHYMEENIERHLTLHEMAGHVGCSVSRFSARFKAETGHSPLAYFNRLKVRQACLMLDTTNMKVNQICHKIGISDTFYFSRLFRRLMGMSPKAYRQARRA